MAQQAWPVDVISVCSADGRIRPLRLRFEDESRQILRINVDEVLDTREITHVGAEAQVYVCRAVLWDRPWTFELRYSIRNHAWLLRRSEGERKG